MRFEFCGNLDCPEWVLSEIAILNKMSAIKLKLILAQLCKKLTGSVYDSEKIHKLCRDQKFDQEETKVLLALVEFLLSQAARYVVSESVFQKDLLQMGVAIENANQFVKVYGDQGEAIGRILKQNSMRVSQIQDVQYSVNYILASSKGGLGEKATPIDLSVGLNIDLIEFPKVEAVIST